MFPISVTHRPQGLTGAPHASAAQRAAAQLACRRSQPPQTPPQQVLTPQQGSRQRTRR